MNIRRSAFGRADWRTRQLNGRLSIDVPELCGYGHVRSLPERFHAHVELNEAGDRVTACVRAQDPFSLWHRRGLGGRVEHAERLVRTDAAEDGTDGFFVAVFQR